jgi:hypothetical protein
VTGARPRSAARERLEDVAFVVLVSSLPVVLYVSQLGFYLDDYVTLSYLTTADEQSFWSEYSELRDGDPKSQLRPLEYAVLTALYRLFGANPLPHQVFMAALVPACAAMTYLVLHRVIRNRYVALGAAVLFALAPHYSSARFWVAAFSPTAVLMLFLASLYCVLRALESRGARLACWVAAGCVAMLLSLFVYEIALPLFVLTAAFFGWRAWRVRERDARVGAVLYGGVLVLAIAVKLALALELGAEGSYSVGGYEGGLLHHIGYVTSGAVKINFGTYGLGLPYVLWWILDHRFSWGALAVSLGVGAMVFAYVFRRAREGGSLLASRGARWPLWLELVAAGLALIATGYGLFIVTGQVYMTSVGIDNRVNVIPALGMAVLAVGLLLRGTEWARPEWRGAVFSLGIAGLASAGALITSTIAGYWGSAYDRQQEVMAQLRTALPPDPSRSTVLLDGVCPEIGPGVVYYGVYDFEAALQTRYRDRSIHGALLTEDVGATPAGVDIGTSWLRTERRLFPYDLRLLAYDAATGSLRPLIDRAAALRYLGETQRVSCPPPRSFAWGVRTGRWVPFA